MTNKENEMKMLRICRTNKDPFLIDGPVRLEVCCFQLLKKLLSNEFIIKGHYIFHKNDQAFRYDFCPFCGNELEVKYE